jgi:hypothetical protein
MELVSPAPHRLPLLVLAVIAGALVVGAAFYGWMQFGSTMLLTLAETGLSGCL